MTAIGRVEAVRARQWSQVAMSGETGVLTEWLVWLSRITKVRSSRTGSGVAMT